MEHDEIITVEINGVKTAETNSSAYPSGYIGLQRVKVESSNLRI